MRNDRFTERNKVFTAEAIQEEMRENVVRLATPSTPGESVKACIRRVSGKTGLGFGQIRRLWYGNWRVIPAHVADQVRKAVENHERRLDAELATLRSRNWALTHMSSDPEFYSQRAAECSPPSD